LHIKIADFGLSALGAQGEGVSSTKLCGTPDYLAPEMATLARHMSNKAYGPKVDVWAIGVILYIMICGYPPFYSESDDEQDLLNEIVKGRLDFPSPEWDNVNPQTISFVKLLCRADPESRPSAKEALAHEWVQQEAALHKGDALDNTRLRQYVARRRTQKAFQAVRMIVKMEMAVSKKSMGSSLRLETGAVA